MRKVAKGLALTMGVTLTALAIGFGDIVPVPIHAELYKNLLTCSAIVFGVMGAWVAIIYPRTLTTVQDGGTNNPIEEVKAYSALQPAMLSSTLVLAVILAFGPAAAIVVQGDFFAANRVPMLRASMGALALLTLWQLWALAASLVPFIIVRRDLAAEARRRAGERHTNGSESN